MSENQTPENTQPTPETPNDRAITVLRNALTVVRGFPDGEQLFPTDTVEGIIAINEAKADSRPVGRSPYGTYILLSPKDHDSSEKPLVSLTRPPVDFGSIERDKYVLMQLQVGSHRNGRGPSTFMFSHSGGDLQSMWDTCAEGTSVARTYEVISRLYRGTVEDIIEWDGKGDVIGKVYDPHFKKLGRPFTITECDDFEMMMRDDPNDTFDYKHLTTLERMEYWAQVLSTAEFVDTSRK